MEYVLDTDKWRCGEEWEGSGVSLGEGPTYLLNDLGYMCCIGQFSEQAGVHREDLLGEMLPCQSVIISTQLRNTKHAWLAVSYRDSFLIDTLASTNDGNRSIPQKIRRITEVLEENGHTLKVIGTAHLGEA